MFTSGVDSKRAADSTNLKFALIGEQPTLTEIWHAQDSSGERLLRAKSQLRMANTAQVQGHATSGANQP